MNTFYFRYETVLYDENECCFQQTNKQRWSDMFFQLRTIAFSAMFATFFLLAEFFCFTPKASLIAMLVIAFITALFIRLYLIRHKKVCFIKKADIIAIKDDEESEQITVLYNELGKKKVRRINTSGIEHDPQMLLTIFGRFPLYYPFEKSPLQYFIVAFVLGGISIYFGVFKYTFLGFDNLHDIFTILAVLLYGICAYSIFSSEKRRKRIIKNLMN